MTTIKTWQERCEEHPDHEGIVTERMIRNRMQEEIDELRQAIAEAEDAVAAERESVAASSKRDLTCVCGAVWDGEQMVHAPRKREWVGLTGNEARKFYEKYTDREELIYAIDKFLEEKNT